MDSVANASVGERGDEQSATHPRLTVNIYQIAGDEMFLKNRIDGTGWDWCSADWRRDWMDQTPSKYAYRCLPLTIANQTGWWVRNPVGFTAVWRGQASPNSIEFLFDSNHELWLGWINNQFGEGIITWNTPFLFRTKPVGSRLLIIGPANSFKHAIQPLTAIIESDWVSMSFTMNWRFTAMNVPVRFEVGEPLFQVIPIGANICGDLESASVTYMRLTDDLEVAESFRHWSDARHNFHAQKSVGAIAPDGWQRDYFAGQPLKGGTLAPSHMTKILPPAVRHSP